MRTEDLDRRITDGLRALADEVEPSEDLRSRALGVRAATPRRRAPRVAVLAVAAAAVALLAGVLVVSDDDDSRDFDVATSGGALDGWKPMPEAPIAGRSGAATVWTGDELLIWGGSTSDYEHSFSDGAAYDPASGRWREMAPGPSGSGGAETHGVWTGEEALFFWIGDSIDGPEGLAAYNPGTDSWRELEPWPLGPRDGVHVVWTGELLVAAGGVSGDRIADPFGAAYDLARGEWAVLPDPPFPHWVPGSVMWAAEKLIGVGGVSYDGEGSSIDATTRVPGAAYDPVTGAWQVIADGAVGRAAAATDAGLVVEFAPGQVGVYDADADSWTMHTPPDGRDMSQVYDVLPAGDQVIVVTYAFEFDVVDPATGTWTQLERTELGELGAPALGWTGRDLVLWSGDGLVRSEGAQYRVPCAVLRCDAAPAEDGTASRADETVTAFLDALRTGDIDAAVGHVGGNGYHYEDAESPRESVEQWAEAFAWLVDAPTLERIATETWSWTPDEAYEVITVIAPAEEAGGSNRAAAFVVDRALGDMRPPAEAEFRIQQLASEVDADVLAGATLAPGDRVVVRGFPLEGGATAHINGREVPTILDYDTFITTVVIPTWAAEETDLVLTMSFASPELPGASAAWYRSTGQAPTGLGSERLDYAFARDGELWARGVDGTEVRIAARGFGASAAPDGNVVLFSQDCNCPFWTPMEAFPSDGTSQPLETFASAWSPNASMRTGVAPLDEEVPVEVAVVDQEDDVELFHFDLGVFADAGQLGWAGSDRILAIGSPWDSQTERSSTQELRALDVPARTVTQLNIDDDATFVIADQSTTADRMAAVRIADDGATWGALVIDGGTATFDAVRSLPTVDGGATLDIDWSLYIDARSGADTYLIGDGNDLFEITTDGVLTFLRSGVDHASAP